MRKKPTNLIKWRIATSNILLFKMVTYEFIKCSNIIYNNMKIKKALIILFLITIAIYTIINLSKFSGQHVNPIINEINDDEYFEEKVKTIQDLKNGKLVSKEIYSPNREYMINNNIAQYSSNLIIDNESLKKNLYQIETFIQFNGHQGNLFGSMEDFMCLVKILKIKGMEVEEEIIELDPIESPYLFWYYNKKLIFNLDIKNSKFYSLDRSNFNIYNILVAVIWKADFDKDLSLNEFKNDKLKKFKNLNGVILSYSLIKYQIPLIIESNEPRLQSVGLCAHFLYSAPSYLLSWIKMHLLFKVDQIVIYDGTAKKELTKTFYHTFGEDERITVVPFKIMYNEICNESIIFNQFKELIITTFLRNYLKESCENFYEKTFNQSIIENKHWAFEQTTGNDCFTILSRKHEFIGYYDIDEYVFPRHFDSIKDISNTNASSICSIDSLNSTYRFYNYIITLVENNRNGRDISQLSSIRFQHKYLLMPNTAEKNLIHKLGSLVQTNKTLNFPLNLTFTNSSRWFRIEKNDLEYVDYLYKTYTSFIKNVAENYLENITEIDKNLLRYTSILTENNHHSSKEIHYYKNVKSISHHNSKELLKNTWNISTSSNNFISHFRVDLSKFYDENFGGSIRTLNFDIEYINFLLRKFSQFCNI